MLKDNNTESFSSLFAVQISTKNPGGIDFSPLEQRFYHDQFYFQTSKFFSINELNNFEKPWCTGEN